MDKEKPLFILAGNGPYGNRGCEAIVRGTTKILREHFRDPCFLCFTHFQSTDQFRVQRLDETDPAIIHLRSYGMTHKKQILQNFWRPETWFYAHRLLFDPPALKYQVYRDMLPHLDSASAVLSVGGDNYSLDYGVPRLFTGLDDIVIERKKPLAIWGASIGPFDKMPRYEQYMSRHLQKVSRIFAREPITIDYLKGIGVTENVSPVADPAFLMDPIKPEGVEDDLPIDEEAIGLNLSPLMARYVTRGNLKAWTGIAASIVTSLTEKTGMPIYLIPHVTGPTQDDYGFMQRVLSLIKNQDCDITLVSPEYNAAETKWIVSQMAVFAGARTHSTIASLSSGVPTLSFAYSIKTRGINRDIFGHTDYCTDPIDLHVGEITSQILSILDENAEIRKYLARMIPQIQRNASNAGKELKGLIGE